MSSDAIPIFPKAEVMYIHSGNICNWNRLKQKISQAPESEVKECFGTCMSTAHEKLNITKSQYISSVDCSKPHSDKISDYEGDRHDIKLTAKVFLTNPEPAALDDALKHVKEELGLTYIDSLLLSFPPKTSAEKIHTVWKSVEQAVQDEAVLNLGVCDMDKDELEELYDWAQVKPATDQVNLVSCCVMPPELVEYAKEKEIQLLTHNDPPELLNNQSFTELVSENFTLRDSEGWQLQWVIRYTSLIRCRGIIKSKGYMLRALRDIRGKRTV